MKETGNFSSLVSKKMMSPSRSVTSASTSGELSCLTHGSSTIRRLADEDVRAIFECLHGEGPQPSNLQFSIVPAGPGMKLSPPSYEFKDGLYILLRPEKKSKKPKREQLVPQCPEHLEHLLIQKPFKETCPWSLSGPQFPTPTAIQQRYCYPKGSPEYSSRVGGALWTMYGADGKEDLEFRLLHVYFSSKRAVNKGLHIPSPPPAAAPSPHAKTPAGTSTTSRSTKRSKRNSPDQSSLEQSTAVTNSTTSQGSGCHSPYVGFGHLSPPVPRGFPHQQHFHHSAYHAPSSSGSSSYNNSNHFLGPPSPLIHPPSSVFASPKTTMSSSAAGPFRQFHPIEHGISFQQRQGGRESISPIPPPRLQSHRFQHPNDVGLSAMMPPASVFHHRDEHVDLHGTGDGITTTKSLDVLDLNNEDSSSYACWDDQLLSSIVLKPSHDDDTGLPLFPTMTTAPSSAASSPTLLPDFDEMHKQNGNYHRSNHHDIDEQSLEYRLQSLQLNIRESILQAPTEQERQSLLSVVTDWAKELAKNPLQAQQRSSPWWHGHNHPLYPESRSDDNIQAFYTPSSLSGSIKEEARDAAPEARTLTDKERMVAL
mmetsp:Transcript_26551/g.55572  ORF Transcript_26551/g.55572 Transcript_26551/m.55572 type:complete len:594 (-) Transcript_26551:93-1874(-)